MKKIGICIFVLALMVCRANSVDRTLERVPEWQLQTPDPAYTMRVHVIPESSLVRTDMELNYVNNTSDTLHELYFRLDLNAWEKGSLLDRRLLASDDSTVHNLKSTSRGYIHIDSLLAFGIRVDSSDMVYDNSILKIKLPAPVAPGQMVYLLSAFESRLPVESSPKKKYWQLDDWYPRICICTDSGWVTDQYLWWNNPPTAPADYNILLSIDTSYEIACAGQLLNEKELYGFPPKPNDDSIFIDVTNRFDRGLDGESYRPEYKNGLKEYAFTSKDRALFSFVVMPSFKQDRAFVGNSMIEVCYNDRKKTSWADSVARFTRDMIREYQSELGNFPHPQLVIVAADTNQPSQPDPQFIILPRDMKSEALKTALAVSIAGCWFGQGDQDNGVSRFFEQGVTYYVAAMMLNRKYGIQSLELLDKYEGWMKGKSVVSRIYRTDNRLFNPYMPAPSIADSYIRNDVRMLRAYPAYVARKFPGLLYMLRFVVGDSTVWRSLGELAQKNLRGPVSLDQFETSVDSVAALPLDWFWTEWSDTTKSYDFGVYDARSEKKGEEFDLKYRLTNHGQIIMPLEIGFVTEGGDTLFDTLKHDVFTAQDSIFAFGKMLSRRPVAILLDPHHYLFDKDRFNNYYFFMPIRFKYQDPPDLFIGFRKL